jgi:drug/metabolite transporter (DMT)-like permease
MNKVSYIKSSSIGTAASIGAILLWCWSGTCFRFGSQLLGAMPYLALSSLVGVLAIMLLRLWFRGSIMSLFKLPFRVVVAGFFGVAVYTVILIIAVGIADEKDIGQIMLINYLWSIWMVLLGVAFLDEKPKTLFAVGGVLIGFAGIIVAGGFDTFMRAPSSLIPHFLSLVGAFLWALYCVLLKRWHIPEEQAGSTFHFAMCAILSAIIATVNREWAAMRNINLSSSFWILFLGIGPIGLGYYWWEISIKRGAVHLAAILANFIPIGSTLLVAFFFRKALTIGLLPGAALITIGAYLGKQAMNAQEKG